MRRLRENETAEGSTAADGQGQKFGRGHRSVLFGYRFLRRQVWSSAVDVVIIVGVYYLLFDLRLGLASRVAGYWHQWTSQFLLFICVAVAVHLSLNYATGNYNIVGRYVGLHQAVRLVRAGIISALLLLLLVMSWPRLGGHGDYLVARSIPIIGGGVVLSAMIAVRFGERVVGEILRRRSQGRRKVLLIGAGHAAEMLIRDVRGNPSSDLQVVGLLDDNPSLRGMSIDGFRVLGTAEDAARIAKEREISEIIIAIPSATGQQLTRIYRLCKPTGLPIKTLPSLAQLIARNTVHLGEARDIQMIDLLGRPAVTTDRLAIRDYIHDRTVMVTGAGGSIGSELCYQIAECSPRNLILVDHDESALYEIQERLKEPGFPQPSVQVRSILDRSKMEDLFDEHRPSIVFHAAAYKHVPLMEAAPDQAVVNNVKGTYTVAELAGRYGAERFVYISTDKAVEPVSVMGATKRAGELIMRRMSRSFPDTLFATVRFGNVLGSQGSVIPLFKWQIENGGPVIVTHPDMRRFFMLIEEAVQLVLQAAVLCDQEVYNGLHNLNTYVLEMGRPIFIVDVAQKMLDFYWKDPDKSIGVEFSGLRPGEKLDETLTWSLERVTETGHPLIKRVCAAYDENAFDQELELFERRLPQLLELASDHSGREAVIAALAKCVQGFEPLNGTGGKERQTRIVHSPRSVFRSRKQKVGDGAAGRG